MTHYLGSKDGIFRINVEMGCNYPDSKAGSPESIGCSGKCEECEYSIASTTVPAMLELIKRANCVRV